MRLHKMPVVHGVVNEMGFDFINGFAFTDCIPVEACVGDIADKQGTNETVALFVKNKGKNKGVRPLFLCFSCFFVLIWNHSNLPALTTLLRRPGQSSLTPLIPFRSESETRIR